MTPDHRRIEFLESRVNDLSRKIEQIPRQVSSQKKITRLQIIGGNTLGTFAGTSVVGIKSVSSTLTIPAAIPTFGGTYADGLGYGQIVKDDYFTLSQPVWICVGKVVNIGGATITAECLVPCSDRQLVYALSPVVVNVGGVNVNVYMRYR